MCAREHRGGAKRGGIRDALKIFWKPVEFMVDKSQDRTEFLSIHLELFPSPTISHINLLPEEQAEVAVSYL